MSRFHLRRAGLILGLAAALPLGADAAGPDVFHGSFSESFDDVVCGVSVDVVVEGRFSDKVFFDRDGNFVRFQSNSSGKTTFTAENGKSVVVQFANQYSTTESFDDEAGTVTFTDTFKGLPEKIQLAGGPVLLRDAGLIGFVSTYEVESGDFVSFDVVAKGPHPDAESDFEPFGEVFTPALA